MPCRFIYRICLRRNDSKHRAMTPTSNWNVITGAPSSGKTAVIEDLNQRGFRVVPEVARAIIETQLAAGKELSQIKADIHQFERSILTERIRIEARLRSQEVVFFDRALPDSMAYYILEGLDPSEVQSVCRRGRYNKVFLFDRLKLFKDGVRTEDDRLAQHIDQLLGKVYRGLGYPVLRVPVMPIAKRTDWVLARI